MTAVRAGVGQDAHFVGGDRAVALDAGLHPDPHRMAGAGGDKFLFAGVFVNDRAARGNGQMCGNILHQDFLLAAETAADPRLDHADAFDRQPEHRGEQSAHVERHLGGGADDQAVIFVPVGDRHVRFDMETCWTLGTSYSASKISSASAKPFSTSPMSMRISAARFFSGLESAKLTYSGSSWMRTTPGCMAFAGSRTDGSSFIFNIDQLQGLFGDLRRFGGDKGHPVTHKADFVIQ